MPSSFRKSRRRTERRRIRLGPCPCRPSNAWKRHRTRNMSDQPPEDPLVMARRHVAEGEQRIVRQEEIVSGLLAAGHHAMVPQARAVLSTMRQTLALAGEDLARLE